MKHGQFISVFRLHERLDPSYYLNTVVAINNREIELGKVAEVRRKTFQFSQNHTYWYIEISKIDPDLGLLTNAEQLTTYQLPTRARYLAGQGDVLVALVRPERGAVAIVPEQYDACAVSSALAVLEPRSLSPEIIQFCLRSPRLKTMMGQLARSATIPTLSIKDLKKLSIPYLSQREQTLLTDELKEIIPALVQSQQKLDSVPDLIDKTITDYLGFEIEQNSSIVYTVPYGKLKTDRLDVSYYNPQSNWLSGKNHLNRYQMVALNNIITGIEVGTNIKFDPMTTEGKPVLRNNNVLFSGIGGDLQYVPSNTKINTVGIDNVLICLSGINTGMAVVVNEEQAGWGINQSLAVLTLSPACDPRYLCNFLNSSLGRAQVERLQMVSGRPYLTISSLREFIIPLLSISEQRSMSSELKSHIENLNNNVEYWQQRYQNLEFKYLPI